MYLPLLSPQGLIYFKHIWGGVGSNRDEGLIWWGGGGWGEGLFNLTKTIVSVLHKDLEYKVENLKYKKKTQG